MNSRPDPAQPPAPVLLVVGAALVDDVERPTRLLAARRSAPAALAGGWELPGGKVDAGESPLAALHRELVEELGVQVVLGPHVPGPRSGSTWPLGDHYEMLVWLASVETGVPTPLEDHDELRWLALDELYAVPWLPADLPIVRRVEARMRDVVGRPTNP
ncbi:MAG TPA: (deoxy)nucleoside triphosphate pyrophosphohydrolase [Intrasporangium sp.]|uniref:(deoxy)nucleoside triphosphate pyrophosphohydrolase n=1 Tax=Intrasporangium sp. TaxID=1925024 RepID=UPI002D77CE98|nr:(deoxy)nucleoside triphosphate pyrophosphohydrolase [Intrasporangium sp.]HET7397642.1 (deoxy)nucleoside triphosphate pyrophosphohydrolase [Intrasporangium sp.]